MFGRTGNAKPSVTQASAWVTYLLLAIGIISPVVCVIWLVQKTVESENALVRELVEEARERSLVDAESLIRLTAMNMVPNEENGGVRYAFGQSPVIVTKGDSDETRSKLADIRKAIADLEPSQAQLFLAESIANRDVAEAKLLGGRLLGPVLIEMGLNRLGENETLEDEFRYAIEGFLLSQSEDVLQSRQLRYTFGRYVTFSESDDIQRLNARLELLESWIENGSRSEGLASGDGYFSMVDSAAEEVFLFPTQALLKASAELDSLQNNRFELSMESVPEGRIGRRLEAPFEFLYIHGFEEDLVLEVSSDKSLLYVWIGVIVLSLSVLSGVAIVVSVRRQASVTQLKDNLVATVTHELKTPVASIRLLVDTLMHVERREKVDTQEYIELISRENQRLGRLIDNFLSFSRMERSKGSFDIVPIAPATVVGAAEEAFRERFKGQRFSLDVEVGSNLPDILGDADALATVLGNLLENAFKYGGREREIVLRARNALDGVEFEVEDFGQGIPPREQKRIFRKFYQVNGSRGAHSGSVGLGLSIVDFVVSKHSGRVELESEEGVGSLFKVRIPYA